MANRSFSHVCRSPPRCTRSCLKVLDKALTDVRSRRRIGRILCSAFGSVGSVDTTREGNRRHVVGRVLIRDGPKSRRLYRKGIQVEWCMCSGPTKTTLRVVFLFEVRRRGLRRTGRACVRVRFLSGQHEAFFFFLCPSTGELFMRCVLSPVTKFGNRRLKDNNDFHVVCDLTLCSWRLKG